MSAYIGVYAASRTCRWQQLPAVVMATSSVDLYPALGDEWADTTGTEERRKLSTADRGEAPIAQGATGRHIAQ